MQQNFIKNNDLGQNEIINIKKEALNLVNSSEFLNLNSNQVSKSVDTNLIINTQPHNNNNNNNNNNFYYNASQQQQQQQQHEQRDREAIEALLNTTNFDLYSNEQNNINMTNDSEVVSLLDEIFNASVKNHNYNDNLMDSLN